MSERDPAEPGAAPDPAPATESTTTPEPTAEVAPGADPAEPATTATEPAVAAAVSEETTPMTTAPAPPAPPTATPAASSGSGGGNRAPLYIAILVIAALGAYLLLTQGGTGGETAASASASAEASVTEEPSVEPTAEPTEAPTPSPTADACAAENLQAVTLGRLTVGTDNPAFPPYFSIREGGNTPPWEDLGYTGDPTTGEGFESAVAYAVATQMGFATDDVSWVVVPFANSIAPGNKSYDFVINQVSYSAERANAVDLSEGYYDLNQGVVALVDNPAAQAKSLADLKPFKFGAQVGTTSYTAIEEVIAPDQETQVYDSNTAAIAALVAKQIDAIVVDLPTADFIANAGVEIESGLSTVVGQFSGVTGEPERFSLALGKGNPITPCVDKAVIALREDGTLAELASKWLPFQDGVPVLQ